MMIVEISVETKWYSQERTKLLHLFHDRGDSIAPGFLMNAYLFFILRDMDIA